MPEARTVDVEFSAEDLPVDVFELADRGLAVSPLSVGDRSAAPARSCYGSKVISCHV